MRMDSHTTCEMHTNPGSSRDESWQSWQPYRPVGDFSPDHESTYAIHSIFTETTDPNPSISRIIAVTSKGLLAQSRFFGVYRPGRKNFYSPSATYRRWGLF